MGLIESFIASESNENVSYEAGELLRNSEEMRLKFLTKEYPSFPQLRSQLEFLFDFVRKFFGTSTPEENQSAFCEAVLALKYTRDALDFVPDMLPGVGLADDSIIVCAVLNRNAPAYEAFAAAQGIDWATIKPIAVG